MGLCSQIYWVPADRSSGSLKSDPVGSMQSDPGGSDVGGSLHSDPGGDCIQSDPGGNCIQSDPGGSNPAGPCSQIPVITVLVRSWWASAVRSWW